jgi:tRNA-specific 2-thiouridylase
MFTKKKYRGLGLLSGWLDSMLAAAVLREQGIEVAGVCFVTPFYGAERARQSAAHLKLPLQVVDFTEKFFPLIFAPPHGFGKGHNPCIDCHILMLREAAALMTVQGFDFLFTGEVLGQRPMSQHRGSLNLVARESGYPDLVLRPLSARLLKPTLPEREGWVDRERLLNLNGRGRKPQIALAQTYGITQYPAPAGGCLLTDPRYVARFKELLAHSEGPGPRDAELLKLGRHFRLPGGAKAVVGRIEKENDALLNLKAPGELLFKVQGFPGPSVLIPLDAAPDDLKIAAALAAAYSDAPLGTPVTVAATLDHDTRTFQLDTPAKDEFKEWLI